MKIKTLLILILCILILSILAEAKNYPIEWTPKKTEKTFGLGETGEAAITFVSSERLENVDLWIVPELQPFISVIPSHFDIVEAKTQYQLKIEILIPIDAEVGFYDGTIHMRVGNKTCPQTFKIYLEIVNATKIIGSEGGQLITPDGYVNVTIPPGSLNENTLISILCPPISSLDLGQIGKIVKLYPEGKHFSIPVSLNIQYNPALIPPLAKEENLFLGRLGYFESWEILDSPVIDQINNTISVYLNHFSSIGTFYSINIDTSTFKLRFPIKNYTPFNAPISSVFDHHHIQSKSYIGNEKITAFTGEVAFANKDIIGNYTNAFWVWSSLYGFKNQCNTSFFANGNYTGGGSSSYLFYDGHPGIDYNVMPSEILAAQAGKVIYSGWQNPNNHNEGFGLYVKIDHGNGYHTLYGHLSEILVNKYESVVVGQAIGISGESGEGGYHLHFEVRYNGVPTDPYGWGGSYSDPYIAENKYLWNVGNPIQYVNIPQEYKCDSDNDGIPNEIDNPIANWLSFIEGNPGVPGDGIYINATYKDYNWIFELDTPITADQFSDGFTATVFLPSSIQNFNNFVFLIKCSTHDIWGSLGLGSAGGAEQGFTTINGVIGIYVNLPQWLIQSWVDSANIACPGCNITLNDLYIAGMCLIDSQGNQIQSLDAVLLLPGQNSFNPDFDHSRSISSNW